MKRIVSVCLPRWPIERLIAAERQFQPIRTAPLEALVKPLALVEAGQRGVRITSVNAAAEAAGVRAGDALADARAVLPSLVVRDARVQADKAGLRKLAHWLGRYGIARNAYGMALETSSGQRIRCYGLWVDIAGVAQLYGGEGALLADLAGQLARFGLTAQLGLADTIGAAHALAWYGSGQAIAPPGHVAEAIAPLPVAALRLDRARVHLLSRLGFKQIGALVGVPRLSLEKRFRSSQDGQRVLLRLDQALGLRAEPRRPLIEPPVLGVRQSFPAPLMSSEALDHETAVLVGIFCTRLEAQSVGTQAVRLTLYRSDGTTCEVAAAFSRAVRSVDHIHRLLWEKLSGVDLGFGVDLMTLDAVRTQRIVSGQVTLTAAGLAADVDRSADLIDRLVNRLGSARITCLQSRASHWPERRSVRVEALAAGPCDLSGAALGSAAVCAPVPALLLDAPEAITVLAEIPDGAPARFIWRRLAHRVVRADGPQRIAPEWWLEIGSKSKSRPRDYYRVEDDVGARFWVFRDGDYASADDVPPTWFLHGLMA